jgi:hypothetical protein
MDWPATLIGATVIIGAIAVTAAAWWMSRR